MEGTKGIWAVVKVAGGQYIGALPECNNELDVLNQVDERGRIFMKPAFEFSMMMRPTPEGIQRQPLTVPINVCMDEVGVWLWPSSISFFDDMSEQDQKSHKSLIEAALKDIVVSKAAAAGLDLSGKMPGQGGGRLGDGSRFG